MSISRKFMRAFFCAICAIEFQDYSFILILYLLNS